MDLALPALIIATVSLAISITVLLLTLPRRRPAPPKVSRFNPPEDTFIAPAMPATGPSRPPARPGPTTQMIRRIDQNLPRETGRRSAQRKDTP